MKNNYNYKDLCFARELKDERRIRIAQRCYEEYRSFVMACLTKDYVTANWWIEVWNGDLKDGNTSKFERVDDEMKRMVFFAKCWDGELSKGEDRRFDGAEAFLRNIRYFGEDLVDAYLMLDRIKKEEQRLAEIESRIAKRAYEF